MICWIYMSEWCKKLWFYKHKLPQTEHYSVFTPSVFHIKVQQDEFTSSLPVFSSVLMLELMYPNVAISPFKQTARTVSGKCNENLNSMLVYLNNDQLDIY